MYKTLKQIALSTLKSTGAFRAMADSRWRSERLLILCYHGISLDDEHLWRPDTYITADFLESRLRMLRDGGYQVLSLQDGVKRLYAKTLPPKSVVLTFDDGLYNFDALAVPLLKKYGFPATLYLTTYYTFKPLPVFPLLVSYLLWKANGIAVDALPEAGLQSAPDLTTPAGRDHARDAIVNFANVAGFSADQKQALAVHLAAHLRVDLQPILQKRLFHLVSPEESRAMAQQGIDIQLHTHRHRTPMDGALFKKEVVENGERIHEILGHDVHDFCYPSGVYRMHYLPILKELGVTTATTCEHAIADRGMDPLLLPRFLDSANVSALDFEGWLTGIGPFIRARLF